MFAAWPRRVLIAFVAMIGCLALLVFASAVVKAEQVVASWYGPGFEGNATASGEPFDPYDYTAAHRTYEFGTRLIVTYEGRSVAVRVNDRGPYIAGRDLDLSRGAAEYLGLTSVGVATVNVEVADPGTPSGPYDGTREVSQEAPADQQTEEPVQSQSLTVAPPAGTANRQGQERQDRAILGEDQYVSEDQSANHRVSADHSADHRVSADQSANDYKEAAPLPPAPKPAVPVLPPEPEPAALESPPAELVVPNSTIERRIELKVAATPAPAQQQPVDTPGAGPVVQEKPEPLAEPVAQEESESVVEENSEPMVEEKSETRVEEKPRPVVAEEEFEPVAPAVEEQPQEPQKSEAPGGLTVLPNTGGVSLGVLAAGALLLGAGLALRVVRR
ncbi:MAG TPA: septal ring lytic transglycosylase RlpA family protein [Rubrobacteraceae bacterium]|nr:septal ring lytic transglycosylase RlpA family protein [Rubrobacteraceae bacterium]